MNLSDFVIIYLACGAPFGVYYFIQNRRLLHRNTLLLNSFLTIAVWFPYAFKLLGEFAATRLLIRRIARADEFAASRKAAIDRIEKEIAQILLNENTSVALFDFRETFQRYAGLTAALQSAAAAKNPPESGKELFRAVRHENAELGARILGRQNLNRLKFHQNSARREIIRMFGALGGEVSSSEYLHKQISDFFRILNDTEAENTCAEFFNRPQTLSADFAVRNSERDLWKPITDRPQPLNEKTLNLQAVSATAIRKRN